ncbi:plastocyanin/azurin family copper-binding protein [Natrinema sp. 1APR25-10V2]|uniref:cupredoxin domain-containing protein n=1 Tax=Natrinema sp. 1APR25-10V2 TaxID=2951081 RepID=UPI0028767E52|nr:plastocyanin/azurin family copper-binding protein [Natrinema sp. 1APR25-10V2]MDS0477666.1 plastocyanin/azurin family copper-binding protein [Natrinema sp. 1APR25-10V2]
MTNEQRSRDAFSRRGVLRGTAVLAGTAATAGSAGAYRDEIDVPLPAAQNDGEGRTLTLLGIVGGWVGVSPAGIDGLSNPPLRLIEGEEHEVIWTNGDGSTHNFNITAGSALDDDAEILESTESLTEQGESTSLQFTATEEMSEYFCVPHPAQMRGPIELIDPDEVHELRVRVEDEEGEPLGAEVFVGDHHAFSHVAAKPGQEAEEEGPPAVARFDLLESGEYDIEVWTYDHERVTDTVTIDDGNQEVTVTLPPIEPGEPTTTFEMRLEDGQWVGVSPDSIAEQANPTLELEADETYAIEWENTIGRDQPSGENRHYQPLPGHNLAIASGGDTNELNTYVRSDFLDQAGGEQTVEFVAREEMGVYLDQAQLDAIGEIDVQ